MAAAGISIWRIQVFGRWGSSAVLRYVREAQLASSRQLSTEVRDSLTIDEVRDDLMAIQGRPVAAVTDGPPAPPVDDARLEAAVETALERRFGAEVHCTRGGPAALADSFDFTDTALWTRLRAAVRAYDSATSPAPPPRRIRCGLSIDGVVHVARDAEAAVRGWQYSTCSRAVMLSEREPGGPPCKRCARLSACM